MIKNEAKTYFSLYREGMEDWKVIEGFELNFDNIDKLTMKPDDIFCFREKYNFYQILIWDGVPNLNLEKRVWRLLPLRDVQYYVAGVDEDIALAYPRRLYSNSNRIKRNWASSRSGRSILDNYRMNEELDELRDDWGHSIVKGRKLEEVSVWQGDTSRSNKPYSWKTNKVSSQWRKNKRQKVCRHKTKWQRVDDDIKREEAMNAIYD